MSSTYWSILVVIIYYSTVVYSSSCQPLNHQLSQCNNYITSDSSVYYNSNQSSQLAVALNATVKVIGSYCRDRSMELLCNYFFPQCMSDNIVPICSSSCSEYLHTGICFDHIFALLIDLNNTENYPNVSVDNLLQLYCSPPYNLSISEDCVNLTDVPDARDHVQCAPVLENGLCSAVGTYAIDVAQDKLNIATVNAFKRARSAVLESDIDRICITLLDLIICIYRFPPCQDFKLILPCGSICTDSSRFVQICYTAIVQHVNNPTVRDHFSSFNCLPETYYVDYDRRYFVPIDNYCVDLPDGISLTRMLPTTNDTIDTGGKTDTNNVNTGIVIGVVLSTCMTILIVAVSLLMIRIRRKRKHHRNNFVAVHKVPNSPTTVPFSMLREFEKTFAGEIINPNDLIIKEQIGEGVFGKVHKGVYTKETEVLDVAIKTLRPIDVSKTDQFIKECIIAKRFNHHNILNLIGVSYIKGESVPLMILPFMCNGDVKSFVKSKRGNILEVTEFPEGLDHNFLVKICLDIAKGMEYLASLRCVHRDLAARNCMLDKNMIAKVADFGLSRDVYLMDYYRMGHDTPLPIKWLAPEALIDKTFTTQSDVWSFGVTCWEIFTLGLQPYPSVDEHDMVNYLKSGKILDKPILSLDKMYEIMKSCWNFVPEDRPKFSLIVKQLNQQHPVESQSIESDE